MSRIVGLALGACLVVAALGCTGDDDDGRPTIVATTSILGDVVQQIVGDEAEVTVVMPAGADPHEFQPSARVAAELREADLVIANGLGFEAGLADLLASAEDDGVDLYEVAPQVDPIDEDPHVFTDPIRMADAVGLIAAELERVVPALAPSEAYADELLTLSDDIEEQLAAIPAPRRKLVTNHEVFAYFADRYGFEVVGVVIPGGATGGEPSASELGELADVIRDEDVPAIFTDDSAPADLADALADEVGADVEVVSLFSESLGEEGSGGETYLDMMRTNAERIAAALRD